MLLFEELLQMPSFSLEKFEKRRLLNERIAYLDKLHRESCIPYRHIADSLFGEIQSGMEYDEAPFLPVALFKKCDLKSVPDGDVFKTMTSSGTTGQQVSKIYLDRTTANNQQKVLTRIVSDFTGQSRMPMIIIDSPNVIKDRKMFSARGAGILGFSIFASKKIYALDENMELNLPLIEEFLQQHKGEKILLFGFTFMIWQHFYKPLLESGKHLDISNGILIHGGGWKKLLNESVSKTEFKQCICAVSNIQKIHDYYGMVEQTGCIYMECECGHLHASIFSDIITRDMQNFKRCAIGEEGVIQVISTIPESYPGHSILTEDTGVILGEDDCPCGRPGKYFELHGRIQNAETRGCSDTYDAK